MPTRRTLGNIYSELEDAEWEMDESGTIDAVRAIVSKMTNSQLEKVVSEAARDLNWALGEGADEASEITETRITITGNIAEIQHYQVILRELQTEIKARGLKWMGYSRSWERERPQDLKVEVLAGGSGSQE